jgi:hypothetical protein
MVFSSRLRQQRLQMVKSAARIRANHTTGGAAAHPVSGYIGKAEGKKLPSSAV